MRKETYESVSFINTDAEIVNKTLASRIPPLLTRMVVAGDPAGSLSCGRVTPVSTSVSTSPSLLRLVSHPPPPHPRTCHCIWAKFRIKSSQDPSFYYTCRLFFQIKSCYRSWELGLGLLFLEANV